MISKKLLAAIGAADLATLMRERGPRQHPHDTRTGFARRALRGGRAG